MKKKIAFGIGTLLFALFAYWQLNDLGQYGTQWWQGWFLTYALTSFASFLCLFISFPRWVFFTGAVAAIIHATLRLIEIQPDKTILFNENNPAGNEAGGLLIVCAWMIFLAKSQKK